MHRCERPGRRGRVRVTVIIPCRDGERYLAEAVRSVIVQPYRPLEVIVVDDGSTDGTPDVVRSFGHEVGYLRQPPAGAGAARNHGLALAGGQVIGFLDADDLWTPGALPRLVHALEAEPAAGMVVGRVQQFVSPELPAEDRLAFRFPAEPMAARLCGTVLARRTVFDRVGDFSTSLASGEFIDWVSRAEALRIRSATVPDVVLRRRLHRLNHGVVRREARQDYLRVVKAALDRRRALAPDGGAA